MSLDQEKYTELELKEASISNKRKQRWKTEEIGSCVSAEDEKKLDR